jgi:outer membrane protein insertion porin family
MPLNKRLRLKALVFSILLFSAGTISQGQKLSELEIVFAGNHVFSSQQLLERTNTFLKRHDRSKGEFNPELLEYCMRDVANFMRAQGHLRAVVGEPKLEAIGDRLRITVSIEEGPLYRLGEIKIDGARLFSAEQLREMIPLKTGDIANGETIGKWLFEYMQKLYANNGYIEYTAEPVPYFRPVSAEASEGIVDFQVTIEEGLRFSVRRILFVGNEQTRDKVIRDALLIKEGEFFNRHAYDESIKNLNQLGLFEEIDSDKDMKMKRDDESAQIDLIIQLKEKAKLRQ